MIVLSNHTFLSGITLSTSLGTPVSMHTGNGGNDVMYLYQYSVANLVE